MEPREPTPGPRLVLLAGPDPSSRAVHHHVARFARVERIIVEEPVPRRRLLVRRARKLGWMTALGQLLFQCLVALPLRRLSAARIADIQKAHGMCLDPPPDDMILHVESINSPECIAELKRLDPDVVLLNGTRILSPEVLASVPARFLNTHAGITPLYRGVHGAYWALVEGRPEHCGVTVHRVDSGIDTGGILAQATIRPTARDNFATYPWLQLAAALPLLERAILEDLPGLPPPEGPSRLWSHPTLPAYCLHRLTKGVR